MWIRGGHEKFIPVWINRKKWRPKKKKKNRKGLRSKISTNSGCHFKILAIFHEFLSEEQKKKKEKKVFIQKALWNPVWVHKNNEITGGKHQFGSLRLDLHFKRLEPVDFFGSQSSLGGTIFVWGGTSTHLGGARPRNAPPPPLWRRACTALSHFAVQ